MDRLYAHTGELRYAKAAHCFDELPLFHALAAGKDVLDDLHTNTTIPKVLGAARRFAGLRIHEDFRLNTAAAERADITNIYLASAKGVHQIGFRPVKGKQPPQHKKTLETQCFQGFFAGGPEGIRTHDLTDANRTLSQLSYRPLFNFRLRGNVRR